MSGGLTRHGRSSISGVCLLVCLLAFHATVSTTREQGENRLIEGASIRSYIQKYIRTYIRTDVQTYVITCLGTYVRNYVQTYVLT